MRWMLMGVLKPTVIRRGLSRLGVSAGLFAAKRSISRGSGCKTASRQPDGCVSIVNERATLREHALSRQVKQFAEGSAPRLLSFP
jgi:hypothetical protein